MRSQILQIFVDALDRSSAIKEARKKLREKYSNRIVREIFSVHQQGQKRNRYVIWYRVRPRIIALRR